MRRIILFTLCLFASAEQVFAVAASEKKHSGVRGSIEVLSIQEPSLDRDDRMMYRATTRNRMPGYAGMRIDSSIQIAPDLQTKSKRVQVDRDLYYVSSTAAIEYTKLFRFSVGLGPIISHERSTLAIDSNTEIVNFTDYGVLIRGDIDYAFNRDFEANFDMGWQSRSRAKKSDWSYGFGFGMNF
jgi:hypothetical protein